MRGTKTRRTLQRLAFGPAAFTLIFCATAAAASAETATRPEDVFRKVSSAESVVVRALGRRDSDTLAKTAGELGQLIEAALKRREGGQETTACDMAAHSLAFAAVSAAEGLANKGEAQRILFQDAVSAATDFRQDMRTCEKLIRRNTGSHTSVEKALRAL
ncbi:MAG: hypothetical protein QMD99_13720 [Rhizobiaceae bacterium]|nr:hypothetical protein [Rhizobiaceae bacterium]